LLLQNDRLLKAIKKEKLDRTPVWIMRQAGRYLPEYRKTRSQAGSFMHLCQTPELACEVTLQPIRRYNLDAAIIFSDILTIPHAMGLGLQFIEGQGPIFTQPLRDAAAIKNLQLPTLDQLSYVYQAIHLVQRELNGRVPLIGFCGSPWTLALYMLEGKAAHGFPKALAMCQSQPALFHHLLHLLADAIVLHLKGQIDAGVQVVMLFDSWAGLAKNAQVYESLSLFYIKAVIEQIKTYNELKQKAVPIILFAKGGGGWLHALGASGCDVLGLDWEVSLSEARKWVGEQVSLQGNLNPAHLLGSEQNIRLAVKELLADYGSGSGHIFNLGHGITPDVPPENVQILIDSVHEYSRAHHR